MALSTEQESILAQVVEAWQNGKAIGELEEASGTNPYNLYCEVLDEDGASKKAKLANLLPYLEEYCSYGVERDTTVSAPECTRIGNAALHKSLPVHSRMKGCLLDDDGNVVEYLDPKDWTGNTRDGSRGQVMVEIPLHYRRFSYDGNVMSVRVSEYPLPGYHVVPKMYVSAYQAAVDRSASVYKLASVVNTAAAFRGGNNNSAWDGTYRSLLGIPATALGRDSFRSYARNRNAKATSEWNCMTYDVHKALYWLFVIEYATLNCQASYNAQLTTEGYRQGGLGAGVTDMDDWGSYNSYEPMIPCGCTDSLGNQTGVVTHNVIASDGETVHYAAPVPRYRGVENPFGHIWHWTDGINVRISPTEENGGDGLSKIFVCSDPSKFSDTGYDGYSHVGNEARASGYVKNVVGGEYGEMLPSEVGGGSTTYYCDYHYTEIPTKEALRGVLFGGHALNGASAGFAYAHSSNAPSDAIASVGSRLCFIPA